jgi:hypothetical protein
MQPTHLPHLGASRWAREVCRVGSAACDCIPKQHQLIHGPPVGEEARLHTRKLHLLRNAATAGNAAAVLAIAGLVQRVVGG